VVTESFDVVVMGAGPAGEAVVRRLEGSGLGVALVERELVGGECAYWACVPSKTLLRAAEVRAAARHVPGLSEPKLTWDEIARYRDSMISHLQDTEKVARMEQAGATLVRGTATIAGPGRVTVDDRELRFKHLCGRDGNDLGDPSSQWPGRGTGLDEPRGIHDGGAAPRRGGSRWRAGRAGDGADAPPARLRCDDRGGG
jgi:choline dehydrogenase-like flavoprotein